MKEGPEGLAGRLQPAHLTSGNTAARKEHEMKFFTVKAEFEVEALSHAEAVGIVQNAIEEKNRAIIAEPQAAADRNHERRRHEGEIAVAANVVLRIYVRDEDFYVEVWNGAFYDFATYESWTELMTGMSGWFRLAAKVKIMEAK